MPTIKIDDKEYDLDKLSENAKAQLQNLQVSDQVIARLNAQLAICKTAQAVYAKALKTELSANE